MIHSRLDQHLRAFDDIETIQFQTNQNISDFGAGELVPPEPGAAPRMPEVFFFDQGPVFISKHHRFADMPEHKHAFIEMNYMYSGSCTQCINGEVVQLTRGQLCLLDTDVPHSIERLGEDDILINILMQKETFNTALLTRLGASGIVSDFLINAISADTRHDRYIVFHSEANENLHYTLCNMMCEYLFPREYSREMISSYIPVMFTELMRAYRQEANFQAAVRPQGADLVQILQYMEHHSADCSLSSLAARFNFNPNYLGNLLKKRTGKTFVELLQSQRMNQAAMLLTHSHKSIEEIASEVGYESLSFFYKIFAVHFGCSPGQYRESSALR